MRYIPLIFFLLITACIFAQDVQFTAQASPDVLRIGEQFNLIFSSNKEFDEFTMPDIKDFQLLGGPSQGHSQSVSSINGKITTTSTYQYTYFLRAVREGKFTIPSATVRINNKIFRSNPVSIEVIKATAQTQGNASTGGNAGNQLTPGENELFVRLLVDKKEAYIGEQILATVKIYTKTSLASIDPFKGPDFTGFFTDPIEIPELRNLSREAVEGDLYFTGVLRKTVIIPQKSGELTIEPFDVDVTLRREVRRRVADPFFDDFTIPDIQEIPLKLASRAVKISVKPLPAPAPSSFTGAVGNFTLASSVNKTTTATNEPVTLKIAVSGKGNLKLINEVQVNVPSDFERYDPVINTKSDNVLSGVKTFEYLLIPRVPGNFTIPAVEFTYFDAGAGQFKTLRSESHDITVVKGEGDSLMALNAGVKEDVRLLNTDIRYIKSKPGRLISANRFLALSPWYYLLYVAAVIGFIMAVILRRKMVKQQADVAGMRLRRADKYARKRLKKSEALLKQGDDSAFFEEMLGAIWGYLSNKLSIPVSALSKDTARTVLASRNVSSEVIEQLFGITETCELARYGHGPAETDRHKLYHEAVKVITALQQKLK